MSEHNPFAPGAGTPPPLRVGHNAATGHLEATLGRIREGTTGDIAVLFGPRGNGKTTLQGEAASRAQENGMHSVSIGKDFDLNTNAAFWPLTGHRAQAGKAAKRALFTKVVPGETGHEDALRRLAQDAPALLEVDEAHTLPPDIGGAILGSVRRCVEERLPLFALFAGTPGVIDHLTGMDADFVDRATLLPIGRLESESDVLKALAIPAKGAGLPMDRDALELLVAESQRYPYFLQLLGYSAWDIARKRKHGRITVDDAREGLKFANSQRGLLYDGRLAELMKLKLTREAALVSRAFVGKGRDTSISPAELSAVIRKAVSPDGPAEGEVVRKFSHIGLIWKTPEGNWEPGIPSLCEHICEELG